MSRRVNPNNRRKGGCFSNLPHHVQDSEAFLTLSSKGFRLIINLLRQFNGSNNGDMSCAFKIMKARGWKSDTHIVSARNELIDKGLIQLTRQGEKRKPNLYALTWLGIDECERKLDVKANVVPSNLWKEYDNKN